MTEIALAYSSIDKARAEAISRVLVHLGYTVSPQPLTAGHVDEAKALIVFWSSGSVNSIPINQFAAQASANRKLVSVRAAQADPPAAYALVALHDLSRWTGSLDAPELRTFLQHVVRMAPPTNAQTAAALGPQATPAPRPQVNVAASNAPQPFNFAGPIAAARPPEPVRHAEPPRFVEPPRSVEAQRTVGLRTAPAPQPQPQAQPQAQPQPQLRPAPQPMPQPALRPAAEKPMPRQIERPEPRRAPERRRAGGGGVARVAMGAIAVSVVAGAAVAAFNYEAGQNTAGATPTPATSNVAINVAPNAMPGPTAGAVTDATPETASLTSVQVASAEPLPGATLTTPAPAATVQSSRGWTATLPSLPNATSNATATPISATSSGAAPNVRAPRPTGLKKLTPIDQPLSSTGIVAIDNANLGSNQPLNTLTPENRTRTPEEERAWIRKQTTYGPDG